MSSFVKFEYYGLFNKSMHGQSPTCLPLKKEFWETIQACHSPYSFQRRASSWGRPLHPAPAAVDFILLACVPHPLRHSGTGLAADAFCPPCAHLCAHKPCEPFTAFPIFATAVLSKLGFLLLVQVLPVNEHPNIFLKFKEENEAEGWGLASLHNLYLWICHQTKIML